MLLFLEDNGGNADYKVINKTDICIWSGREVGMGNVEGSGENNSFPRISAQDSFQKYSSKSQEQAVIA